MRKIYGFLLAAIVSTIFYAGSAVAFQGLTIGVMGNDSDFDTAGREIEGTQATGIYETSATKVSKSVDFPSIFAEYTWTSGMGGMTVGVEVIPGSHKIGSGTRTDTSGATGQEAKTYSASADVENMVSAYVEPTLVYNDMFGIYLKAGLNHITVKSIEDLTSGTDDSSYGNATIWGGTYGVGIKGQLPWGLLVKLEAMETQYETFELVSTTGNKNRIKAKPNQSALRLGIGYNF